MPLWPFAAGRARDCHGDHEPEAILQRGRVGVARSGHHASCPGYKDGVRIEAYHGAGFARPTLRSSWPERITAHGAALLRDDLAWPGAIVVRSPPASRGAARTRGRSAEKSDASRASP